MRPPRALLRECCLCGHNAYNSIIRTRTLSIQIMDTYCTSSVWLGIQGTTSRQNFGNWIELIPAQMVVLAVQIIWAQIAHQHDVIRLSIMDGVGFRPTHTHSGLVIKELTGDMQLTKAAEEWDVVTRKTSGENDLVPDVTTSCIVTVLDLDSWNFSYLNYIHVPDFLRVNSIRFALFQIEFNSSFCLVPLEQQSIGGRSKTTSSVSTTNLDLAAFEKVSTPVKENHQVMVFVHARKETVKTSQRLIDKFVDESLLRYFDSSEHPKHDSSKRDLTGSRNKEMKQIVKHGLGVVHPNTKQRQHLRVPARSTRRTLHHSSIWPNTGSGNANATSIETPTLVYRPTELEALALKLKDPTGDMKTKIHLAIELHETISFHQRDKELSKHLEVVVTAAVGILTHTEPAFVNTTWDYKFRYLLLDTLARMPMHEHMKPHALSVMSLLIQLSRSDNAKSANTCFKLGVDLYRSFKTILEPTTTPFFNTIIEMYNMAAPTCLYFQKHDQRYKGKFDDEGSVRDAKCSWTHEPRINFIRVIPGMKYFKALQECPFAVVFLLQTYKIMVQNSLASFLPVIFKFIKTSPLPQVQWHEIIAEGGQGTFVGIAPAIIKAGKRTPYNDLVVAQIMSFIAYVLRAQPPVVQPFAPDIPVIVIRMLKNIPPESSPSRRELIIAARHILGNETRSYFLPYLNGLFDHRIFIRTGVTSLRAYDIWYTAPLQHLVYSTTTTSDDLKPVQINSVLIDFMNVVHDPTTTSTTQAMASKAILTLVEYVGSHRFEPQEAKAMAETRTGQLATSISRRQQQLVNLTSKDVLMKMADKGKRKDNLDVADITDYDRALSSLNNRERTDLDRMMIERSKMPRCLMPIVEPSPEQSKAILQSRRTIIRVCITSSTVIVNNLKKMKAPLPNAALLGQFLIAGLQCLTTYDYQRELKEVKEIVDTSIHIFTQIHIILLTEIVELNIKATVNELRNNTDFMAFPQYLLANSVLTKTFIHDELILPPHLSELIMESLSLACQCNEPGQYYSVLRACFGGLFKATRVADIADDARQHLYSLTLTDVVMDALLDNLTAAIDKQHFSSASQFTLEVLKELFERPKKSPPPRDEVMLLAKRTLCVKASSSCYDHSWPRKCAGHEILSPLINDLDLEMSLILNTLPDSGPTDFCPR
ncbi:uncharacterized protein MELLADRAFT_94852 [Melampsora larici-populina 98AG31]|uniref:Uncharacterized protein n=1 Tax=Melampsora larici-populina (strain 98AG31 / pathotype 3-4-7) TaxID=747676 RepID=F4S859_MELLP|nr:uncharacterized protein MELLADRAFT_94852 [Melampsora larici-populina 98AG31]EGF99175.1 hypothetical protein MELLADRAFT_94852 [Melampsora larici-populina 98AG31]